MKIKMLLLILIAGLVSSCGTGLDAAPEVNALSGQELTHEYLFNLEANKKTLLTLDVELNTTVTLYVYKGESEAGIGTCSDATCYFEYPKNVDSVVLITELQNPIDQEPIFEGNCERTLYNQFFGCSVDLNKTQVFVTVSE